MYQDGTGLIVDAGMNALLQLGKDAKLSTLAVFPNDQAKAPDGTEIPMNAVPTDVAIKDDGSYLVGQLTGFPVPAGWRQRLHRAGWRRRSCRRLRWLHEHHRRGFGARRQSLRPGVQQRRHALDRPGQSRHPGWATDAHRPRRLTNVVASEGLVAPTGLAVDADGNVYVSVYGVLGTMGQVWKIAPQA